MARIDVSEVHILGELVDLIDLKQLYSLQRLTGRYIVVLRIKAQRPLHFEVVIIWVPERRAVILIRLLGLGQLILVFLHHDRGVDRQAELERIGLVAHICVTELSGYTQLVKVFRDLSLLGLRHLHLLLLDQLLVALCLLAQLSIGQSQLLHSQGMPICLESDFLQLEHCQLVLLLYIRLHWALVEHVDAIMLAYLLLRGIGPVCLKLSGSARPILQGVDKGHFIGL